MDNKISGGLEHLVTAKLFNLTHLDLSNNKINAFDTLAPLVLHNIPYLETITRSQTSVSLGL
jgi:hypothetical protein